MVVAEVEDTPGIRDSQAVRDASVFNEKVVIQALQTNILSIFNAASNIGVTDFILQVILVSASQAGAVRSAIVDAIVDNVTGCDHIQCPHLHLQIRRHVRDQKE